MKKRYQIFISSTFKDLKDARNKAQEVILRLSHIPIGMELFNASDKEQWEIIQNAIDESDYYLLIIGNRYGSIDEESQLSFTEKEYYYAKSIGIPIYVFILEEGVNVDIKYVDFENKDRLKKFKEEVQNKRLCEYWSNIDDLGVKISTSLQSAFEISRPGWIRGNQQTVIKQISLFDLLESTKQEIFIIGNTLNSLYSDYNKIYDMLSSGIKINLMCMSSENQNRFKDNCLFLGANNIPRMKNAIVSCYLQIQERLGKYLGKNLVVKISRYPIHIGIVGVDIETENGFLQASHLLYSVDTNDSLIVKINYNNPIFEKYKNHLMFYWNDAKEIKMNYIDNYLKNL